MLSMLFNGQYAQFFLIVIALVISLSFHEFGHAFTAKLYGDDTAERMGRLTLNPLAHIDPIGLLMVMTVGFGYAKPVPTNPNNFTSRYADLWVSAAGPGMNLLLAIVVINGWSLGIQMGFGDFLTQPGPKFFISTMAVFNIVLMMFNLIPLGQLDGHYILPYFLSRNGAMAYRQFNAQYGHYIFLGLIMLSFAGIPVFRFVFNLGYSILPYLHWF